MKFTFLCITDIDECASNPCMNDGTCTDGVNSYRCACSDGYVGENCDEGNSCIVNKVFTANKSTNWSHFDHCNLLSL